MNFISRFISQHTDRCLPFFKLLKKEAQFGWDEECQRALDRIHEYLGSPPVLSPPKQDRPLLYVSATTEAMAAVLAQHDDDGRKERAIYFISKSLDDNEKKFLHVEKLCLAVVWATSKSRHYLLCQPIKLLAKMDPLKYIFSQTTMSARVSKWQIKLLEFDISYVK